MIRIMSAVIMPKKSTKLSASNWEGKMGKF